MPKPIQITKQHARRFMLAHHGLWPPRRQRGKAAILDYIAKVGCIQFDTINVVTRNADLVLQARVKGYKPVLLESMLYEDRSLWDGWDKVQSIYRSQDWPHFEPHRQRMQAHYQDQIGPKGKLAVATMVREAIKARGPLSSLDIDHDERLEDWGWGDQTRAARASMEVLYAMGELGIHTRVNTRRVFDLVGNLLPADLLAAPHPHASREDYQDWHVLRRVGGMGLAQGQGTDHWLGISHLKSPQRYAALGRLEADGLVYRMHIEGLEKQLIYMRAEDLPTLEKVSRGRQPNRRAAFIAPLDNLTWQRKLLDGLFNFHYRWEVYVPAVKRQYAYYVLPVIYGDQFVARLDPALDKKTGIFTVNNWWWQADVNTRDGAMLSALAEALRDFGRYLGAKDIVFSSSALRAPMVESIKALI